MRTPHHALRFGSLLATEMLQHGLRQGAASAARKASPVLMVLEAAACVADAIDAYLQYRSTTVHRDHLEKLIPLEQQRLRAHRKQLATEIERTQIEMDARQPKQERLGALLKVCAQGLTLTWEGLQELREADLPDLDIIDQHTEQLEDAWRDFKRAMAYYQDSTP